MIKLEASANKTHAALATGHGRPNRMSSKNGKSKDNIRQLMLIVDCGASSHFSPDKHKLINFEVILPEPIRATDGHTFLVIGCRDLVVTFPVGSDKDGPPVTLK
jgi:hypothetical protein